MKVENLWDKAKELPTELLWRAFSYLLTSVVLLPFVSLVMFLFYMAEHGFFSYDFVADGIFAMKLFFFTSVLLLVVTALGLFGLVTLIVAHRQKRNIPWQLWLGSGLASLLMWLMVILGALAPSVDYPRMGFMLGISALVAAHITVLVLFKAKHQFISLAVITALAIYLPAMFRPQAAQMVGLGLSTFGVGGVSAALKLTSKEGHTVGHLILITPGNIYLQSKETGATFTFSRGSVEYFCVSRRVAAQQGAPADCSASASLPQGSG